MMNDFSVDMNEYLPLRDVVFNTLRKAILKGELKQSASVSAELRYVRQCVSWNWKDLS